MDIKIKNIEGKDEGKVKMKEEILGIEKSEEIIKRVVRWKMDRRKKGYKKEKGSGEVRRKG